MTAAERSASCWTPQLTAARHRRAASLRCTLLTISGLPATPMDGLQLLRLRRRQPTAPTFGAARGPRFVHATAGGAADGGYGACDWLAACDALKRRRAAVAAARDAENNAIADGYHCANTLRRWRRRARICAIWRRALSRTGLLSGWTRWRNQDRDLARLQDLGRRALSTLRKRCADAPLFQKWRLQAMRCREGARLSAALHKLARRKLRTALRLWRARLEILRRNACKLGGACRKWRARVGLARGWSRWRRWIVTGKAIKLFLHLKLGQGFKRWAQTLKEMRSKDLRQNECANRVVEVLFCYRGRQELRCAFTTWRRAVPKRTPRPRRQRAKPARRGRVGQCSCVYGTSAGFSCKCSKKTHAERRLDVLRQKVDRMLTDGDANLPKPPRSERAKRVHLAGSGRFHAFLDVANDPQRNWDAARKKRGDHAKAVLRKSMDAARRRVPGADPRVLEGPPTVERMSVDGADWSRGRHGRSWW